MRELFWTVIDWFYLKSIDLDRYLESRQYEKAMRSIRKRKLTTSLDHDSI